MATTRDTNPYDPSHATAAGPRQGMFVTDEGRNVLFTFTLVSSLFLLWGFCNGMIDVMDKHFQEELNLTLAQSAWVQFFHYLGYFVAALPAGWLAQKLGYKGGIIAGLLMVAVGGAWFIPATQIAQFWAFLLGVCVIAAGLTFLETIANPYTTVLGPKEYAATRINLAQSCNGVGWILGPIAGGAFFYGKDAAGNSTGAETLWIPYAAVAVGVAVLAALFALAPMPDIKTADEYGDEAASGPGHSIWSHPHFVMAVIAQFFYVAAQAGIFSFFINYMTSQPPALDDSWSSTRVGGWLEPADSGSGLRLSDQGASNLVSLGAGLFLLGRITGAWLLKTAPAHRVLGFYGLACIVSCGLVAAKLGWVSVIAVFATYFFMSIMFPTIFALGIYGLGSRAKTASAYIVMAIMGGALLPKLMGYVADQTDISRGFLVPLGCFAVVAVYGFLWPRLSHNPGVTGLDVRGGH